jgi:hypothetical protein
MSSDFDDLERRVRAVIEGSIAMRRDLAITQLVPSQRRIDAAPMGRLFEALDVFPGLVGYLNSRRDSGSIATIKSEADVQDLLYLSLKPIFPELVYEQPTEKGAAGYSIGDFQVPSLKLILEAKYVAKKADVKMRAHEIQQDIWQYTSQTDCERIVFFVYDPLLLIPDRPNYSTSLSAKSGEYISSGRAVEIRTVIKP